MSCAFLMVPIMGFHDTGEVDLLLWSVPCLQLKKNNLSEEVCIPNSPHLSSELYQPVEKLFVVTRFIGSSGFFGKQPHECGHYELYQQDAMRSRWATKVPARREYPSTGSRLTQCSSPECDQYTRLLSCQPPNHA